MKAALPAPNDLTRDIHDRTPVIFHDEAHDLWLDRELQEKELLPLLVPYPSQECGQSDQHARQ